MDDQIGNLVCNGDELDVIFSTPSRDYSYSGTFETQTKPVSFSCPHHFQTFKELKFHLDQTKTPYNDRTLKF